MGLISGGKLALGQIKGMGKDTLNWARGNKGQVALAGFTSYAAVDEYEEAKANGSSTMGAVAEAGFDAALGYLLGLPEYIAYEAVVNTPTLIKEGAMHIDALKRQLGRDNAAYAFQHAQFNDTEQVYTMRQAGMAIAQRSRFNMEQAMLGNEAKYMMR